MSKVTFRNTMDNKRLKVWALLYIHRDIKISPDEVISELTKKPRRIIDAGSTLE